MLKELTVLAIPVFFLTMAIEAFVLAKRGHAYDRRDTAASLSGGVGNLLVKVPLRLVWFASMSFAYEHRVMTLSFGVGTAVALFLLEDLTYYVWHRLSHEVRLFWAGHVVHHSSQRYTLATALRQSWTSPITTLGFWMPLSFLGFRPEWVAVMSSISLLYQYWIHTETIDRLGPLEWIFNTPSHHRVHHGSNARYIDRNHAGILIIWDRMFGTFEPETEKVHYGLTKNLTTHHPVRIQFHEFADILRDVRAARTFRDVVRALTYMPPRPTVAAPAE